MNSKIISIVNQKGGVGKTTTAVNLATILCVMNKKVLLVDIDSQGNSSSGVGIAQFNRKITSYHLFCDIATISDAIQTTEVPGLSVIPSNTNLAAAEIDLANMKNHEYILKKHLTSVKHDYDYIIIDCPPSLNLLTINALAASNEIIIPMLCDFYSLEGLSHLIKTIEIIKKNMNKEIKICGILFTMYDGRNKLARCVEKDVRDCLGDLVFKTTIPRNIKVSEAPSHGKAAVIYDHKCAGSLAYISLAKEIMLKEKKVDTV